MFCRKCGEKLGMNDKFCSACGEPTSQMPEGKPPVVLEPPKDLVWNIEGFPKDKKPDDADFDWKKDNQNKDFSVDDFYVDNSENISTQKLLDIEIDKLNKTKEAREEALSKGQEAEPMVQEMEILEEPLEKEVPQVIEPVIEPVRLESAKQEVFPSPLDNRYDNMFIEEEKEEKRSHASPLKISIFTLLILLLLAEAAFLGCKYYMPENPTVMLINEKITQGVMTIQSWFEVQEETAEQPEDLQPIVTEPAIENPVDVDPIQEDPVNPYPDNQNIKEISLNPSLIYVSGKDYGNADINKSLPVTENTEEVVQAVVAYDSKWIDYVNNGDKGVMALTVTGSQAEKKTLSFTNEGNIKETFLTLQIGEIRKGVKGYYIWVREEIELLEKGTSTIKVYNWIYQVVPVENEMKIADYFSYK